MKTLLPVKHCFQHSACLFNVFITLACDAVTGIYEWMIEKEIFIAQRSQSRLVSSWITHLAGTNINENNYNKE